MTGDWNLNDNRKVVEKLFFEGGLFENEYNEGLFWENKEINIA